MAKKSTTPAAPRTPRTPRRTTTKKPAAAPVDIATVAGTEVLESAANHGAPGTGDARERRPTPEEIAEAAYQRYLSRGGQHGSDFDDWLEAERELRARRSR
jgi:hypothetical protein